jgi:hypothetical protein
MISRVAGAVADSWVRNISWARASWEYGWLQAAMRAGGFVDCGLFVQGLHSSVADHDASADHHESRPVVVAVEYQAGDRVVVGGEGGARGVENREVGAHADRDGADVGDR